MTKIDPPVYGASGLYLKSLPQLRAIAVKLKIHRQSSMGKDELVRQILNNVNPLPVESIEDKDRIGEPPVKSKCSGVLKLQSGLGYLIGEKNITVPTTQIVNLNLKDGDFIQGIATTSDGGELILHAVTSRNHKDLLANYEKKPTPVSPFERLNLDSSDPSIRAFDLFAPVGKGQRGYVFAPPKGGATTFLKNLAEAIAKGNPGVILFALLIDEKPENISDFESVEGCTVFSSTFDQTAKESADVTSECFEKAIDLIDSGKDMVVLIDGLAKLVKAFAGSGNEIVSPDNVSITCVQKVQNFLSKATKYGSGGSLTVLASLTLCESSRRDRLILDELKGKENLICTLAPPVGEMFPIFDFENTQTSKEELFIEKAQVAKIRKLRRLILKLENSEKQEEVLSKLFERFPDNTSLIEEFQNFQKEFFGEEK